MCYTPSQFEETLGIAIAQFQPYCVLCLAFDPYEIATRLIVRISAIKPILATFGDFDGVGQLIATKLLTKRVWISSWQGGIQIDCVYEVYPKKIDYHHPGVTAYFLPAFPPKASDIHLK